MATLEARVTALAQAVGMDVKTLTRAIGTLSGLNTTAKLNLVAAINEVQVTASNSKDAIGTLSGLTTTAKTNLVAAINEVKAQIGSLDLTSIIDDTALAGDTDVAYSADKVLSLLGALETKVMGGIAPETLDTIKELADFLKDNTVAGGLVEQLGNRVRVDAAQTFDAGQQSQARANIGAASATSVTALTDAIGDTDHDFAADYATAKA
jgi:hypothetical protein